MTKEPSKRNYDKEIKDLKLYLNKARNEIPKLEQNHKNLNQIIKNAKHKARKIAKVSFIAATIGIGFYSADKLIDKYDLTKPTKIMITGFALTGMAAYAIKKKYNNQINALKTENMKDAVNSFNKIKELKYEIKSLKRERMADKAEINVKKMLANPLKTIYFYENPQKLN